MSLTHVSLLTPPSRITAPPPPMTGEEVIDG